MALMVAALAVVGRGAAQDAPFLGVARTMGQIESDLSTRIPRRFRQVGTSSVTLRVDLGHGLAAAFKPRTRTHPRGYASEIAAYRIARALGMDNVPPAVGRGIPRPLLQQRFVTDHPEDWEPIRNEIMWDAPGIARGAFIYWIPEMRQTELSTLSGLADAAPWLAVSGWVSPEDAGIARDLSTLLAFDYLIGNWDRWSGGNVNLAPSGRRLYVRDHNVAFLEPIEGAIYERTRDALERCSRFSRSFVTRVMALDEETIRDALAQGPAGWDEPVLSDTQIEGVLRRRRAFLSYVGALIAIHGADGVLAWP